MVNSMNDEYEGWIALCVSILRGVPQKEAFKIIENPARYKRLTDKEMMQVDAMRKQGMRWIDIADSFGLERSAMCHRYHNWKQRKKRKENETQSR